MQLEGFVAIYTEYYILAMECLAETSLTGEAFQLQIDFESQLVNSCGFISFHIAQYHGYFPAALPSHVAFLGSIWIFSISFKEMS